MSQRGRASDGLAATSASALAAKNVSVVRCKSACCRAKLKPRNLHPVWMRQRRDSATASKPFFFVAMDQERWRYYAYKAVALQEIHGIGLRAIPLF
jgi:hypothetical protein